MSILCRLSRRERRDHTMPDVEGSERELLRVDSGENQGMTRGRLTSSRRGSAGRCYCQRAIPRVATPIYDAAPAH